MPFLFIVDNNLALIGIAIYRQKKLISHFFHITPCSINRSSSLFNFMIEVRLCISQHSIRFHYRYLFFFFQASPPQENQYWCSLVVHQFKHGRFHTDHDVDLLLNLLLHFTHQRNGDRFTRTASPHDENNPRKAVYLPFVQTNCTSTSAAKTIYFRVIYWVYLLF